jgi:hypothetical protein
MRSAAFFSSNLRAARSTVRSGKLRRRDIEMQRRSGRTQPSSSHKLHSGARAGHVHRVAAPRFRPARKIASTGFADAVLH